MISPLFHHLYAIPHTSLPEISNRPAGRCQGDGPLANKAAIIAGDPAVKVAWHQSSPGTGRPWNCGASCRRGNTAATFLPALVCNSHEKRQAINRELLSLGITGILNSRCFRLGDSKKEALFYLVWVGLMNLIHFVGAVHPQHPHMRCTPPPPTLRPGGGWNGCNWYAR